MKGVSCTVTINFSPELINILPVYLKTRWKSLAKQVSFKFTIVYLYNSITGKALASSQLNDELNRIWSDLGLDNDDLENLYTLLAVIETGSVKYKKYKTNGGNK